MRTCLSWLGTVVDTHLQSHMVKNPGISSPEKLSRETPAAVALRSRLTCVSSSAVTSGGYQAYLPRDPKFAYIERLIDGQETVFAATL